MKTITKTYTVYSYKELSEDAKERVLESFRNNEEYPWINEDRQSLDIFCELFNIKNVEYDYLRLGGYIQGEVDVDDEITQLRGLRLATWIYNNFKHILYNGKCYGKLIPHTKDISHPAGLKHIKRYSNIEKEEYCPTGYCRDYDISRPIFDFINRPTNNKSWRGVIYDCLDSWLKACKVDYDNFYSEKSISEYFESNDYEFDENGNEI